MKACAHSQVHAATKQVGTGSCSHLFGGRHSPHVLHNTQGPSILRCRSLEIPRLVQIVAAPPLHQLWARTCMQITFETTCSDTEMSMKYAMLVNLLFWTISCHCALKQYPCGKLCIQPHPLPYFDEPFLCHFASSHAGRLGVHACEYSCVCECGGMGEECSHAH